MQENGLMENEHWKEKYKSKIMTAERTVESIKPGTHIFIGTGCGEPQALVRALADGLQMVLE